MANTPRIDRLEKNYIINGVMDFRQRSSGGQTLGDNQAIRVQDRWVVNKNDNANFNTAGQGPTSLVDLNGVTVNALNINADALNSSAEVLVGQRIEALNAKELAGGKMSLSFLMKNVNFSTIAVKFYYAVSTDTFGSGTDVLFHTTPDQVFSVDSTVKEVKFEDISVHANSVNGIYMEIAYKGFVLSTAGDAPITKIMLNAGSKSNSFNRAGRDIQGELALCQRYYEKSYNDLVDPGTVTREGSAGFNSRLATEHTGTIKFGVSKITLPTCNVYSPQNGSVSRMDDQGAGFVNSFATISATLIGLNGFAEILSNGGFTVGGNTNFHWTADAEI